MTTTKKCTKCRRELPLEQFRRIRGDDWRRTQCKACEHKRTAAIKAENEKYNRYLVI